MSTRSLAVAAAAALSLGAAAPASARPPILDPGDVVACNQYHINYWLNRPDEPHTPPMYDCVRVQTRSELRPDVTAQVQCALVGVSMTVRRITDPSEEQPAYDCW